MHRRRSKLRIVRPAASGRSHSLRCCSSQITAGCDLSEPSLRLIEIPAWRLQSTLKRSARRVVGQSGLEPPTSRLSVVCSSQLSYWPVWWRLAGSNRWPPACKAGALPAELNPHIHPLFLKWWAKMDSNHRPHDYQSCALASWAIGPYWSLLLV